MPFYLAKQSGVTLQGHDGKFIKLPQKLIRKWSSGILYSRDANEQVGRNIIIDGDYLYGVTDRGYQFVVFDVSDIDAPVKVAQITMDSYACDLRKKGDYVFVSRNLDGSGVTVIDVSDPSDPQEILDEDSPLINLGGAVHGLFLQGNYLYCCMHYDDRFVIVDVTDPLNPVTKGDLTGKTYFHGIHDIHVDGNYAYVANYRSGTGEYGFVVVNVSNPDNLTVVGYAGEGRKGSHLHKKGNYIYAGTHSPDDSLSVFDVSDPASPVHVGDFFSEYGIHFGYWLDWWGDYLIAASSRKSPDYPCHIHLIDVSNPASLSIAGQLQIYGEVDKRVWVMCIHVNRDRIFVSLNNYDEENEDRHWSIRSYRAKL